MNRYGVHIEWDAYNRSHASLRGYAMPRPEFFSVAARLRAMRKRRGRR